MQKVSYMGNGETTAFTFNFPYFEDSDVVVTKNGAAATGYNIVGNSGGLDADIPYVGGTVVFETAPTALDNIVIARSLPLTRQYDYQPTAKIDPTTLNQDMNYLMEVLKDLQDELDGFRTQYAEIADKESTTTLLARISTIHNEIVTSNAQITALGDVSQIRSDITSLKNAENFTTTGKTALAHLAMPSNRYIDLTLETSGTIYTMPGDGYLCITGTTTAVNQSFSIGGMCQIRVTQPSSGVVTSAYTPVSKGEQIPVYYTVGTINSFRFYYANGAS